MTEDGSRRTEDGGRRTEVPPLSSAVRRPSSVTRRPSSVVCCLFLTLLLISVVGCGRKGPPFVPQERDVTAKVTQLEGGWDGKSLALKGIVQGDEGSLTQIAGCRVYYVWFPLKQPPCEGCPIAMTSFRDLAEPLIRDGQFSCRLPAFKQKGICFVMVRIMEKGGRLGPESDRIKLISER